MNRPLKITLTVLAVICAVSALTVIIWLGRAPTRGEATFRNDFEGIREAYIVKTMAWRALEFGGRAGIEKLKKLESEPDMSPVGKMMAHRLVDYLHHNQHIPELRDWLQNTERNGYGWSPLAFYIRYIIWKDKNGTEPNQSLQTTIRTVTDRAPSSTLRASADRV